MKIVTVKIVTAKIVTAIGTALASVLLLAVNCGAAC